MPYIIDVVFRAVAIHQYTSVLAKKKVPIGMQVMYEESKNAFRLTRSSLENQVFRTVCIGTMKMNLLVRQRVMYIEHMTIHLYPFVG